MGDQKLKDELSNWFAEALGNLSQGGYFVDKYWKKLDKNKNYEELKEDIISLYGEDKDYPQIPEKEYIELNLVLNEIEFQKQEMVTYMRQWKIDESIIQMAVDSFDDAIHGIDSRLPTRKIKE